MKAIGQFALIVAILLPFVTPAMACILPGTRLTQAERACCTQMASQCGQVQMPVLHGCCQKDMPTANRWNVAQISSVHAYASLSAITGLPVAGYLQVSSGLPGYVPQPGIALPQSPPAVISILRI